MVKRSSGKDALHSALGTISYQDQVTIGTLSYRKQVKMSGIRQPGLSSVAEIGLVLGFFASQPQWKLPKDPARLVTPAVPQPGIMLGLKRRKREQKIMCPVCITTAVLIASGVASTGGLAAAAMKKSGVENAADNGSKPTKSETGTGRDVAVQERRSGSEKYQTESAGAPLAVFRPEDVPAPNEERAHFSSPSIPRSPAG